MHQQDIVTKQVLSMLDKGRTREEVITQLREDGHNEPFVQELTAEMIKQYTLKRRVQGFTLILAGAVICLFSCIITLISASGASSLTYGLYGATSLGILVVFAGLMKIF